MYSLCRVSGLFGVTMPIPLTPRLYGPWISLDSPRGRTRGITVFMCCAKSSISCPRFGVQGLDLLAKVWICYLEYLLLGSIFQVSNHLLDSSPTVHSVYPVFRLYGPLGISMEYVWCEYPISRCSDHLKSGDLGVGSSGWSRDFEVLCWILDLLLHFWHHFPTRSDPFQSVTFRSVREILKHPRSTRSGTWDLRIWTSRDL